jgi:hypothetical protein
MCEHVEGINIKSNNEDKNDAAETRISRKKRRFESVINEV